MAASFLPQPVLRFERGVAEISAASVESLRRHLLARAPERVRREFAVRQQAVSIYRAKRLTHPTGGHRAASEAALAFYAEAAGHPIHEKTLRHWLGCPLFGLRRSAPRPRIARSSRP